MSKIFISFICIIGAVFFSFQAGKEQSKTEMKLSCDSPGYTVLDNQEYVCLSKKEMKEALKQVYIMGLQARKNEKEL